MRWYILDDNHNPVRATIEQWSEWTRKHGDAKRVAFTEIETTQVSVSTVFLGLDHNFSLSGPPVLFETMVFGGTDMDGLDMWRYRTWDEAVTGHADAVALVRRSLFKIVG